MSQPNNPPSNPLLGAIYIDQVTNVAWVWTGTYWVQADGATGFNAQVGPGATLVPGYYADPSPEDWFPFVGSTPPASPQPGQIWVDTSTVPYTSYVWDSNLGQHVALGGGPGSNTNSIVSTLAPTLRVDGGALAVGDLWIEPTSGLGSYWTGSAWAPFSSPDTHSILSSAVPATRNDGTPINVGDLWLDLDNNALQYYNGTTFVPVTAVSENIQYGAVAPTLRSNGDPLVAGDLWTNSTNGASFYWNGSTFVAHQDISSYESVTAPTTNINGGPLLGGDQWYNPTTQSLYTYDSTISAWVNVSNDTNGFIGAGDPVIVNPQLTRPSGMPLQAGDQYFDTSNGGFYVYNGTGWNSLISADTHSFVAAGDPNTIAPFNAGTRPDTTALLIGDQYIDSSSDISYYWDGAAWESFGDDTHSFIGSGAPTLTARPDGNPLKAGDNFINQTANKFYYYTGVIWKEFGGDTHSFRSTTAPTTRLDGSALKDGDMWVDTDNGNILSVYNIGTTTWEPVGADTHSFYGALAPTLTVRPNGQPLLIGDQYFNTTTRYLSAWNGSGWVPLGPNTHSIRATTAPGTRPDGGALEDGDMWVDSDNGNLLYVYNFSTSTWELAGPDTHSFTGTGAPALTLRPDGAPLLTGDQYLDTVTKLLWAYDGAVWYIISGDTHAFTGNGAPGLTTRPDNSALVDGDQYVDKFTNYTYCYYNGVWNLTGADTHSFLGFGNPGLASRPDGSALQDGDLYIDTSNNSLWYYVFSTGTWVVQTRDLHSFTGTGVPTLTLRPDGNALEVGDQFIDTATDLLYYWDGAWKILSGDRHAFTFTTVPTPVNFPLRPDNTALLVGDQVINTNTNLLYYWDGAAWEQVNPDTHSFTGNGDPTVLNPIGLRPDSSPLVKGDLYVDEVTEYLYYWTGTFWDRITSAETHSFTGNGLPNVIIGTANRPDGDPLIDGDQYFNTASNLLYTYISGTWILTSQDTHSFSGTVVPSAAGSGVNAGLRPDGTTLLVGDQYIDTNTQLLYSWYGGQWNVISGDTHSFIGTVDPATAGSGVEAGTRPDGTPLKAGDMYVNTVTDEIWYYDTGLSQWVNTTVIDTHSFTGNGTPFIASPNVGANPQTLRPDGTALLEGDQYWDKATNILYGYNSTEWIPIADDYHALDLGVMTNVYPSSPNTRPDSTALRFADQAMSKDRRLFGWTEDANGPGLPGWRQIIGYYRMSMYGTTLDPNTNAIYNTRTTVDGTTQGVLQGDMYVDSQSLGLWVADGAGNWEQVNIDTHAFTGTGAPTLIKRPTNAAGYQNALLVGDLYVNTTDDSIYYWNGAAWDPLTTPDTHSFTGTVDPAVAGSLVDTGNRPDGSTLVVGDQYINRTTDTLFYWDGANWDTLSTTDLHSFHGVSSNPQGNVTTRPDGSPLLSGDQYFDTQNRGEYVYNATFSKWEFVRGNWVDYQPGTPYTTTGTNPTLGRDPNTPLRPGDLYIDSNTGYLYVWDGGAWNLASTDTHSFSGTVDPAVAGSLVDAGKRPAGDNLIVGDQYINTTTDALWYWNGTAWEQLNTPDTHSFTGSGTPFISTPSAGTNSQTTRPDGSVLIAGDQYVDIATSKLYYYDGSEWVLFSDGGSEVIVSSGGGGFVGPTTRLDGTALQEGDIWYDTWFNQPWVRTGGSWEALRDRTSFSGNGAPAFTTNPTTGGSLGVGEQYWDTTANKLYIYDGNVNGWVELSTQDTHSTTGSGNPNSTAPFNSGFRADGTTAAIDGDIYFDVGEFPSVAQYVYDTGTTTWHPLSDFHTYTGGSHPTLSIYATGTTGKMYVNTSTNEFYFWDGTSWDLLGPQETQQAAGPTGPTTRVNGIDAPLPGDIWYDTGSRRLYHYDSSGVWVPSTPFTFVQNTTPPVASTFEKDLWVDTTDMTMYVYYNDGATTQWVTIA